MIYLSYFEGFEQYRLGRYSNRDSKEFYVSAMERLYPSEYQRGQLEGFYSEARCDLFHNGMVRGRIIINYEFKRVLNLITMILE